MKKIGNTAVNFFESVSTKNEEKLLSLVQAVMEWKQARGNLGW